MINFPQLKRIWSEGDVKSQSIEIENIDETEQ